MAPEEAQRRQSLSDEALALEIERQAQSLLGAMRNRGQARRLSDGSPGRAGDRRAASRPGRRRRPRVSADRRAGAQPGLARRRRTRGAGQETAAGGGDIGAGDKRARYANARRPDIAMRTGVVDGLNRALMTRFAPIDFARGRGSPRLARSARCGGCHARRRRASRGATNTIIIATEILDRVYSEIG